jgi:predicted house-cleaning NTP pyrophosphatase (Maf/HAM1 superfamily)
MAQTATVQIQMPEMGESVTEGIVLEWHVAEGDFVEEGDTVVEVSTDKVDAEVPAPADGTIVRLIAQVDEEVPVGGPLAEMEPGTNGGGASPEGQSAPAAGPVAAGDPPPPAVAKASSGVGPPTAPPARLIVACDTDVVLDGRALGKPGDEVEAREYLERMSGREHVVMSGLVIVVDGEERSGLERSTVVFKDLSDEEKERYVRFGEWRGRSGGYAIQTLGSTLVATLEGSVSNVVGLPVGLLVELAPELFERT